MVRDRAILGIAALAAVAAGPAAAQTVGVNSAVVNDVRMTSDAGRTVHKAAVKERVSLGNDILTGQSSRLQVLLLDRTSFTLGANARIRVDRFVYDPARGASSVGMSVTRGAFRFMSGKPTHNAPGQSAIRTPVASIGIRGTIVEGAVGEDAIRIARAQAGLPAFTADPETASLILLRGPGAASEGGAPGAIDVTAGGKTVTLDSAGQAVFVPGPGQAPIGPFELSSVGSEALIDLLRNPAYGRAPEGPVPPNVGADGRSKLPVRQLPQVTRAGGSDGNGLGDPANPPAGGGSVVPSAPMPPRI